MMQAGICLRRDTETTLPELTEQHRIRQKEEELSGLESVHMAESETGCAAPGLKTLEPECVTGHSGVSDVHHADAPLIKTETDLGPTYAGDLTTESPDFANLVCVTHQNPDRIKTETDDGGHVKSEHMGLVHGFESEKLKCEPSEVLVSDLMSTVPNGAGVDHEGPAEPRQCVGAPSPNGKNLGSERYRSTLRLRRLKPSKPIQDVGIRTGESPYTRARRGNRFLQKTYLNEHQEMRAGEKPFKCDQCEKRFLQKSRLCAHLRMHAGKKPHACTRCEKCFVRKYDLDAHQRIHTGEKPYTCTQCGKRFIRKSVLWYHQKIHTGEKPYACTQCGKCFIKRAQLRSHQSIHTGEKPFQCSQCGKSFLMKYQLSAHQKIHTGKSPTHALSVGRDS
ncbi:hypothetical protein ANANG_G00093610 [Anguilla anguilla]|uniref:C2H2-type domain-containing protein n=1 Tax=Anguilla anguilla TaxID=7936 RepID=A0A9D3MRN4_ANGAN|nr:hypothetical protein ANANG_G00093610 [Anguilla anguilla]